MRVEKDINIQQLIEMTAGYTCAELEAICNEAGMLALRDDFNIDAIGMKHFLSALNAVLRRTPQSLLQFYDNYLQHHSYFIDHTSPT